MNKVAIVSDSTCDLGNEILEKNNIYVLPLYVNFEDQSYRDGIDITINELFNKVKETGIIPKTSAVTPADCHNLFKQLIDEGFDIVYSGIGSNFSGTFQNVSLVAKEFPEDRIFLVDSENLSTGIGLLILKACKMRDQGVSAREISEELKKLTPKIRTSFVVETLDYLHMGGRCSGTARFFGTMLGVRPLIQVVDGKMEAKKVIGPMRKGLDRMINVYRKDFEAGIVDEDIFFITRADNKYQEVVYNKVKPIVNVKDLYQTIAGCVIGSHCGPGCIGIIYAIK